MNKDEIVEFFKRFTFGNEPGIGRWLSNDIHPLVSERLCRLKEEPLSKVQFNQLLVLSKIGSVSDGFFKYYWLDTPEHPYDVESVEGYQKEWVTGPDQVIKNLEHLRWGMYRVFIDGLLYFGSVKAAFNSLRSMRFEELQQFFKIKRFDTAAIAARGPALPLVPIARDDRYLISEMACKTFGDLPGDRETLRDELRSAWDKHVAKKGGATSFKALLMEYVTKPSNKDQLLLTFDEDGDHNLNSKQDLDADFDKTFKAFVAARQKATENTERYLSMVNDLDVYVATSMRYRKNFRDMSDACDKIFSDGNIKHLHLRYFDPTMSAARGHEDKGLIECLMVKCAKVLIYCEGEKESYGKDAEAAMALSLGKPVIFYCDHGMKTNFYREVHPLARLIDFRSGVAVGAIVSDDVGQVTELVKRIFENRMQYRIEHHSARPGYLKLIESLTGSIVRLQTDDELIEKTFWNSYQRGDRRRFISLMAGRETEGLH